MKNFGFSLNPHYRLIKSDLDIDKILNFFVKELKLDLIEIGFYDAKTYNFFLKYYLNSKILKDECNKIKINLHLPKKDWEIIGVDKILSDAENLSKTLKMEKFIIHEEDYLANKSHLSKWRNNIYVENSDKNISNNLNDDINWVCDVNHFIIAGGFQREKFKNFILNKKERIKELHFSNNNHETFNSTNIEWIRGVFNQVSELNIKLDDKLILFEGTNKEANSLDELFADLTLNFKLFKKINYER